LEKWREGVIFVADLIKEEKWRIRHLFCMTNR